MGAERRQCGDHLLVAQAAEIHRPSAVFVALDVHLEAAGAGALFGLGGRVVHVPGLVHAIGGIRLQSHQQAALMRGSPHFPADVHMAAPAVRVDHLALAALTGGSQVAHSANAHVHAEVLITGVCFRRQRSADAALFLVAGHPFPHLGGFHVVGSGGAYMDAGAGAALGAEYCVKDRVGSGPARSLGVLSGKDESSAPAVGEGVGHGLVPGPVRLSVFGAVGPLEISKLHHKHQPQQGVAGILCPGNVRIGQLLCLSDRAGIALFHIGQRLLPGHHRPQQSAVALAAQKGLAASAPLVLPGQALLIVHVLIMLDQLRPLNGGHLFHGVYHHPLIHGLPGLTDLLALPVQEGFIPGQLAHGLSGDWIQHLLCIGLPHLPQAGQVTGADLLFFVVHHRLCVLFAQEGKLAVVSLLRFRQRLIPLILAGLEQAGFPAHELPDSGSGLEGGES